MRGRSMLRDRHWSPAGLLAITILVASCAGEIGSTDGGSRDFAEPGDPGAPTGAPNSPSPPQELFPPIPSEEISPSLVKARAANGTGDVCAAPCGVHFDATGTTWGGHSKVEADLDLEYRWDFGDPSCSGDGLFEASGQRCNEARGFVAAHLYETPGTYSVTLCVADGAEGACRSTDVVVSDPDMVYPGTQTVCVSNNGDHSGCPAGARRVSSQSDFDAALSAHLGANKRVLFHRGVR